jgi:hypothetical protein
VLAATPLGQAASKMILPKNSVGAAQIRKSAVTGLKVKNGTLMAADFKAGQLPAGAQGPKGDKGDAGVAGISGYVEVNHTNPTVLSPGQSGDADVLCPVGKKALSGEVSTSAGAYVAVDSSVANANGTGWYVEGKNVGVVSGQITVSAICAVVH